MKLLRRVGVLLSLFVFGAAPALAANPFPTRGPTVPGQVAQLRHGMACAPEKAPLAVKRAIWAANELRKRPYRYGGGHRSFLDSGYDCSGTVSYALAAAGLLRIRSARATCSFTGSRAAGNGSPFTRGTGMLTPSSPACAWTRRPGIAATIATRRAGIQTTVRRAASNPGIRPVSKTKKPPAKRSPAALCFLRTRRGGLPRGFGPRVGCPMKLPLREPAGRAVRAAATRVGLAGAPIRLATAWCWFAAARPCRLWRLCSV